MSTQSATTFSKRPDGSNVLAVWRKSRRASSRKRMLLLQLCGVLNRSTRTEVRWTKPFCTKCHRPPLPHRSLKLNFSAQPNRFGIEKGNDKWEYKQDQETEEKFVEGQT